jgi:hypothetical protein
MPSVSKAAAAALSGSPPQTEKPTHYRSVPGPPPGRRRAAEAPGRGSRAPGARARGVAARGGCAPPAARPRAGWAREGSRRPDASGRRLNSGAVSLLERSGERAPARGVLAPVAGDGGTAPGFGCQAAPGLELDAPPSGLRLPPPEIERRRPGTGVSAGLGAGSGVTVAS